MDYFLEGVSLLNTLVSDLHIRFLPHSKVVLHFLLDPHILMIVIIFIYSFLEPNKNLIQIFQLLFVFSPYPLNLGLVIVIRTPFVQHSLLYLVVHYTGLVHNPFVALFVLFNVISELQKLVVLFAWGISLESHENILDVRFMSHFYQTEDLIVELWPFGQLQANGLTALASWTDFGLQKFHVEVEECWPIRRILSKVDSGNRSLFHDL